MSVNDKEKQGRKTAGKSVFAGRLRWVLILVAVAAGVGGFVFLQRTPGDADNSYGKAGTFTVRSGDLTISVTESGDIEAINSRDIKSEVEGRTTIISIVDEGTYITPEDVNNGKVLVELDSSEIKQKLTQQKISFLSAEASFSEAKESLDIQKKQNESDIQAGRMKARFALMDLQKYLGEVVADRLISAETNPGGEHNEIASLIDEPNLGGEALQKLRDLDGDIYLKEQKLELAKSKFEWTGKLYEKKYVSLSEKEADRLDKEQKNIARERAKTAKDLFTKYEFPKQAEKLLSGYNEANRELERIEAGASSKLTQAQAKLGSREATYLLQKERLEKLQKQLQACVIRAPAPGQVVYSSSTNRWAQRNRPIEIGAEIRERQKIISIPDSSEMKVEIKVNETWVDKIKIGQRARITIAAFPDKTFTGKVLKKAPLADQQNWLNPDLKVYATDVSIEGTYDFIKTGMSAKVEVIIDELKDVLSVPIQTVITQEGIKLCYVMTDNGPERREVKIGLFNDNFIEIKSGLVEGEKILLNPPRPRFSGQGLTAKKGKGRQS
ncbi:MAG TPA: HlyD family efflux transporter periplasmic adaptor subunit [Phycisphaerales bacterium]|nr:HlyD family efflux transporter periplasmic adaptor subunit [Phycisphaerales bacterium]